MKKELPNKWVVVKIDDIASYVQRGKSPKYVDKSDFIVVNQKAIRWDGIIEEYLKYIDPTEISKYGEERFIKEGDILWNSTGTGTIGRACYIDKNEKLKAQVVDTHVTIVRSSNLIDSRYLFYFIKSPIVQANLENLITGTTNQVELNTSVIKNIEIPLAPKNEQKRISDKLDQIFSHLDFINRRLDIIPELIKQFKQNILEQAITGKLTKEWRETHSIKFNWQETTVKEISKLIQYGYTESSSLNEIGPKFLRITDIQGNKVNWSTVPYCKITDKEKTKYSLKKGDILFARTGATVGKSFLIESEPPDAIFASYLIRIQLRSEYLPKYIWYYFNSPKYWDLINKNAKGIGQPNVNGTVLGELPISMPSLKEQEQIIKQIESLFQHADFIQDKYRKLQHQIGSMPQSILNVAFKGKLVKQNPKDEPFGFVRTNKKLIQK